MQAEQVLSITFQYEVLICILESNNMDCIYSIVVNEGNAVERYKRRRDFGGVGMQ